MDLPVGTLTLRPYVFAFLAAFLVAGVRDLGARRTLLFAAWVWPVAWLAEFSSTRTGVPFGLYHYTETTRDQELFVANVPLMDSLSFTFLAYAAFCLARVVLGGRAAGPAAVALVGGLLMTALDVVIDPLAVQGDRWFLGRIFYYPDGGAYFGVPVSNFVGWVVVGTVGIGGYLALTPTPDADG
ncbi:MAG TPA: carotenoid biosynthesis protein, partial [Methylomirabilota bacterium]